MNQNYKSLMLGLMLVMVGQSLYCSQGINQSPLAKGLLPLAKFIYQQGTNIKDSLYWRWNKDAYWNALWNGDKDAVKIALSKGMDVNAVNKDGVTALMIAVERGHLEIVKLLLDKDAKLDVVDEYGWTLLVNAAQKGYLEIVKLILDKGAKLDVVSMSVNQAFASAAWEGHLDVVRLLLDCGADVNLRTIPNETALMHAAREGHLEMVRLLLDKDASVNAVDNDGNTALMRAFQNNHPEVIKLLLKKGANVANVNRALFDAAIMGHLDIVKLLLDKGAQVDAVTSAGRTVLIAAAESGHLDVVKLLLDKGADSTGVNFSRPGLEPIAAVFRAQREDLNLDELPRHYRQILDAYHEFQAGRPQRLKELLGISGSGQNMLMNMQQGKSSSQHRPYVARVEAMLGVSRKDLEKVFKEECIAQLVYYLKTGKFADSREQAEMSLGWSQPALAKTVVDEMMPVDDARHQALPFAPTPTFDTPEAPSSDYVPQAALFDDMNTPD